jgi:hypothetical protein
VLVVLQIRDIGNHEIDAQHLLVGELESRIDDEQILPVLQDMHVLADLPRPPRAK